MLDQIQSQTLTHPDHEWVLEHKIVAQGYGVTSAALHNAKKRHSDELRYGDHFLAETLPGRGKVTLWTKQGIIKLGMFVTSEQAAQFREWATHFIAGDRPVLETLPAQELPDPCEVAEKIVGQIDEARVQWMEQVNQEVAERLGKLQDPVQSLAEQWGVTL